MKMTRQELDKILADHLLWINDDGGERANLSGANLSDANLSGADLSGAEIDGEKIALIPIQITGLTWMILITDGFMRIGCQHHSHADWDSFTDHQIVNMESRASAFWAEWKQPLMIMCANHKIKSDK